MKPACTPGSLDPETQAVAGLFPGMTAPDKATSRGPVAVMTRCAGEYPGPDPARESGKGQMLLRPATSRRASEYGRPDPMTGPGHAGVSPYCASKHLRFWWSLVTRAPLQRSGEGGIRGIVRRCSASWPASMPNPQGNIRLWRFHLVSSGRYRPAGFPACLIVRRPTLG